MLRSRGCGKKARRRPAGVECENAPPGAQRANAKQGAKCEACEGSSFAGASGLWAILGRAWYSFSGVPIFSIERVLKCILTPAHGKLSSACDSGLGAVHRVPREPFTRRSA